MILVFGTERLLLMDPTNRQGEDIKYNTHMNKKLRKVFFTTGTAVLVVFVILYLPFTQHKLTKILSVEEELLFAEAIVVLGGGLRSDGSPEISTLERTNYGLFLLKAGFGNYLILSGGVKASDRVEADEMYKIALDKGVSPETLLKEGRSSNTYENALYTKELLSQHNIKGKVILVTSPYHMKRAIFCFRKQGVEVLAAPVVNSEIYTYGFYQNLRNLRLLMDEFLALVYFHCTGWI